MRQALKTSAISLSLLLSNENQVMRIWQLPLGLGNGKQEREKVNSS